MHITLVSLLAGLALCQAAKSGNGDTSRFTISEITQKKGSKKFNDDSSAGGDKYPDYFRVEVEIQRLENEKGMRSDGKDCDSFNTCDPRVQVFIDVDKPLSPWPGSSLTAEYKWPTIFEVSNTNSPTIGKSVTKDICGGSLNKVNARVYVVDVDTGVTNDLINDFECLFDVVPRDVARDAKSATEWSSMECTAKFLPGKMRLLARHRAYEIPSSNCQAAEKTSGTSMSTDSRQGDRFQPHIPGQHDLVRLDVELVNLINPQGFTAKKQACDTGNACDPLINVNLDTDVPLAKWPGSKILPDYTQIFSVNNQNSPTINKNISKDICGGSLGVVNLRANVVDYDSLSSSDFIGNFECVFNADYSTVGRDVTSSDWSATQDCKPLQDSDVRLLYRYRMYDISNKQCGIK